MNQFKVSGLREFLRRAYDRMMRVLLLLGSILALVPLIFIFYYILSRGLPNLNLAFFTELPKPLGEAGGGLANGLSGTLIVVGLASIVGVPFGVGLGLFLSEFRDHPFTQVVRLATDVLASVPSILVGLFCYAILVRPLKTFSAVAAGVALSIIMLPMVARATEELLKRTPESIREAGLALGLPRWKVTLRIVLAGSMSGVVIALARISGETAPLLYTAFGNSFAFKGLFQPIATLPVQIFEYAISPYPTWQGMAWTASLVLVGLIVSLNLILRFFFKSHVE